jgi:hypothetical protein
MKGYKMIFNKLLTVEDVANLLIKHDKDLSTFRLFFKCNDEAIFLKQFGFNVYCIKDIKLKKLH